MTNTRALRSWFLLPDVLGNYNKRHRTDLQVHQVRMLYFFALFPGTWNRYEICTMLAERSVTMNYTHLDRVLKNLEDRGLVEYENKRGKRAYRATDPGLIFIKRIETQLRKYRIK